MRILLRSTTSPFTSTAWATFPANADLSVTTDPRFVHDVYRQACAKSLAQAIDDVLHYRIFPPTRMRAQLDTAHGRAAVGATIGQRVFIGPLALETAVRVIEVGQDATGATLTYATLVGHPEQGIARFSVAQTSDGVWFEAQAWSRSGNWLSRLGRPLSRFLQQKFTHEAMAHFSAMSPERVVGG